MIERTAPAPMPIFVLAGVLGSGKTTLMARLAHYCVAEKRRLGMIVNDIGELGVDAILLAETGWPHAAVDSLSGECACCSDSVDLEDVLLGMRELKRELLLFETTGVADAADMLNQLTAHDLRRLVEAPRLITVIDLTRYPEPLSFDPLVGREIALADAFVLSKADLVAPDRMQAATAALRAGNSTAPIFVQELADSDLAALLDVGVQHANALQEALVDGPPGHSLPHTVTIPLRRMLRYQAFEELLRTLPEGFLRAKGFVTLNVEPSLHTFQYVEPGFVHISPFRMTQRPGVVMADERAANPYGVFIGSSIDEPWLRAALDACVETPPQYEDLPE